MRRKAHGRLVEGLDCAPWLAGAGRLGLICGEMGGVRLPVWGMRAGGSRPFVQLTGDDDGRGAAAGLHVGWLARDVLLTCIHSVDPSRRAHAAAVWISLADMCLPTAASKCITPLPPPRPRRRLSCRPAASANRWLVGTCGSSRARHSCLRHRGTPRPGLHRGRPGLRRPGVGAGKRSDMPRRLSVLSTHVRAGAKTAPSFANPR